MSDLLTVSEVAERLRVSVSHVYQAVARGSFPITPRRIGGRLRFSRAAVDHFIATGEPS